MNIISTIKSALTPKSPVERARIALAEAQALEAEAKAKCDDSASASAWEALERAERTRKRAEVVLSELERRAAEKSAEEANAKRAARVAELEALIDEASFETFARELTKQTDRIVEGERLIAGAVKAVETMLQRQHVARLTARAIARELGVEVDLSHEGTAGMARGITARAIAKAKHARGEFRDGTNIAEWAVPAWAEVAGDVE